VAAVAADVRRRARQLSMDDPPPYVGSYENGGYTIFLKKAAPEPPVALAANIVIANPKRLRGCTMNSATNRNTTLAEKHIQYIAFKFI
jgi:hypothetical protein